VLDHDLPVGLDLVLDRLADRQRADAVGGEAPDVAEPRRELWQNQLRHRWRILGEAHPHEPLPEVEGHRNQTEGVPVEAGHVLKPRRAQEAAIQPVGPGVIAALKRPRLAPVDRAEPGAAMPTDVEEGAERAVVTPDNENALAAYQRGPVVTTT